MLLSSGLNFGFNRTLPHSLGIPFGFFFLLLVMGMGLGGLFTAYPILYTIFKILSAIYLLYLAFRISVSRTMDSQQENKGQPMTFMEAALFQWVNPKAWVMAISGMALYTNQAFPFLSVILIALVFSVLNWPCVFIWAAFGTVLRKFLSNANQLKWFNILMGVLMVASVFLILVD